MGIGTLRHLGHHFMNTALGYNIYGVWTPLSNFLNKTLILNYTGFPGAEAYLGFTITAPEVYRQLNSEEGHASLFQFKTKKSIREHYYCGQKI